MNTPSSGSGPERPDVQTPVAVRPDVRVRRVHDPTDPHDGTRVLIDRLWPRGPRRHRAAIDEWCPEAAPSTQLRRWYGHGPDRFDEFARRYRFALQDPLRSARLHHLQEVAARGPLTLLTATRRPEISAAAGLADVIRESAPVPSTSARG
ncbi:DUF488 domain-containing protein [Pseudonocardia acidicola]|uniref:DUF488 family protein n=1 Tax=Pseudonocardia acidicola TaxID=2724939 RepID=A0ABX1S623_9PSEU|nr:DUF488 family protein [Pseudonocardia acidicola]NMH97026.1 DUF488 family protein [Pseudonocardia acidicola]